MTTVRVSAPCCGVLDLAAERIVVVVPDVVEPYYTFICPKCRKQVQKRADAKILDLLRTAGCDVVDVAAEAGAVYTDALDDALDSWQRGPRRG